MITKIHELTVYPVNKSKLITAYRLNPAGRTTVPLVNRPGTFTENTIKDSYQFAINNMPSLDISRPVNVIGRGIMFFILQDSLLKAMVRYKTGQDYYAILPGDTPKAASSYDTDRQDRIIQHFVDFKFFLKVSGEDPRFPSGLYSKMEIENPDLTMPLFSNIVSAIPDTSGVNGLMVSHDMSGNLFRVYQLNNKERIRVSGLKDPFNWSSLSIFNDVEDEKRMINEQVCRLTKLGHGMKELVSFAQTSGIYKPFIDQALADKSLSFSDKERTMLNRLGWIIHIKGIDTSAIEAARKSRVRKGMCDDAVKKALALFCLDVNDADLENNLKKTYRYLAKIFSPEVISDPETQEVCGPIIRDIHVAQEVLESNLKK